MCLPALAMPIIGAVVTGVGALASAGMQSNALNRQATEYDRQAKITTEAGAYEAGQLRRQQQKLFGTQIAQVAANGGELSGSAIEVMEETAIETGLDIQAAEYGAEVNSSNLTSRASNTRADAGAVMIGGFFNAITPVIGAFSNPANTARLGQNPFSFGG